MKTPAVLLLIGLAAAIVLLPIHVGAMPDTEDFSSTLISTILHSRAVLDGVYPFWTSAFGLGLPQPFATNLLFHPLAPLFGMVPLRVLIPLFFQGQVMLGAWAVWLLCRDLCCRPAVGALAALTYLLSAPTLYYTHLALWVNALVTWTLAPVLLLALLRLTRAEDVAQRVRYSALAALVAGSLLLNGHPGYVGIYAIGFAIVFAGVRPRDGRLWLFAAAVVAAAVLAAAAQLWHLAVEYLRFDPTLKRWVKPTPALWPTLRAFVLDPWSAAGRMLRGGGGDLSPAGLFGGPFPILAALAAVWPGLPPMRRALAVGMAAGFAAMFLPERFPGVQLFSATWLFRDLVALLGTLLAALLLEEMLRRGGTVPGPAAVSVVAVLQVLTLAGGAAVLWRDNLRSARGLPSARPHQLYEQFRGSLLVRHLQALNRAAPGRIYWTFPFDDLVGGNALLPDGLTTNSLAWYDLRVVNGLFKGISLDALYPDAQMPYGHIRATLDGSLPPLEVLQVLNIRYLLVPAARVLEAPWSRSAEFRLSDGTQAAVWENRSAWPDAVIVRPEALDLPLERRGTCWHSRLLCGEFSLLLPLRVEGERVSVQRRHGLITLSLPPAPRDRLVFVPEFFLPGWTARGSRGPVAVVPVLRHLMGVVVPAGEDEVRLQYRPRGRVITTRLSWTALVLLAAVAAAMPPRRERAARRRGGMLPGRSEG